MRGLLLSPMGVCCAGPANDSQAAGLLARRAELDELSSELGAHLQVFTAKRDELASVDANAAKLSEQRSELHSAVGSSKQELVKEQNMLDRHQSDLDRVVREIERANDERASIESRIEEIVSERTNLTDRATKLEGLLVEQQARAQSAQQELETIERTLEEANERVSAARVQASTLHEQLRSEQRQLSATQSQRDETERQSALAQRHIERSATVLDEHQLVAKEAIEEEKAGARADRGVRRGRGREARVGAREQRAGPCHPGAIGRRARYGRGVPEGLPCDRTGQTRDGGQA